MYFEPTDEAVAAAARAVPRGVLASVAVMLLGLAVAAVARRPWLLVLVLPGFLTAIPFLARTQSHGAPLVFLLGSTLVVGAASLARRLMRTSRG